MQRHWRLTNRSTHPPPAVPSHSSIRSCSASIYPHLLIILSATPQRRRLHSSLYREAPPFARVNSRAIPFSQLPSQRLEAWF